MIFVCCGNELNIQKKLHFKNNEITIVADLNKVAYKSLNSKNQTLLKGIVIVTNITQKETSFNLGKVKLLYENITGKIYIDSIASYLITEKTFKKEEKNTYKVYWVFDRLISEKDLVNLKLIYELSVPK